MTITFQETLAILEDHGWNLDTCNYCCTPIQMNGEEEYTACPCSPNYPALTFRKEMGIEDSYDRKELYNWLGYQEALTTK